MAIIPEKTSERTIKQYSDKGKKLKQVFDRLGGKVSETLYNSAEDVIINGKPRYDYVETDEDVDIIEETEVVEHVN